MKSGRNGRRMHAAALRDISNARVDSDMAMGPGKTLKRGTQVASEVDAQAGKRRAVAATEAGKGAVGAVDAAVEQGACVPCGKIAGFASSDLDGTTTAGVLRSQGDENIPPVQIRVGIANAAAESRPISSAAEVRSRLFSMFEEADEMPAEAADPTIDLLCNEEACCTGEYEEEDSFETEKNLSASDTTFTPFERQQLLPFCAGGGYHELEDNSRSSQYILEDPGEQRFIRRTQLVNWLLALKCKLALDSQTFHLSVYFADTFLARDDAVGSFLDRGTDCIPHWTYAAKHKVAVNQVPHEVGDVSPHHRLRRLGVTCLFLASKMVEVEIPSAKRFANASEEQNFSRRELVLGEKIVLKKLNFNLRYTTVAAFARAYTQIYASGHITQTVNYLVDLALHSHRALEHPPSMLAAAAVALALEASQNGDKLRRLHIQTLQELSGYNDSQRAPATALLKTLVHDACCIPDLYLNKDRRYGSAAKTLSKLVIPSEQPMMWLFS